MSGASIGKVVVLIGIISAFLVLSGSVEVTGWTDFTNSLTTDPFSDWPGWPTFGGPTGSVVGTTWYLRDGGSGIGNTPCLSHQPLIATIGASPLTSTISTNGQRYCWSAMTLDSISAGVLNVSLDLTSSGAPTYSVRLVSASYGCDIFGCFWRSYDSWIHTICIWTGQTAIGDNVPFSCDTAIGWGFGNYGDGGARFTIVVQKVSGAGNLGIKFNGAAESDSFVQITPGIVGTSEDCRWDRPGSWATCIGDATAWIGNAMLYIGGLIWATLTGVFAVLSWLFNLIISFFGAIFGMLAFLAGGAGTASPVAEIFQVIFVGMLAMVFFFMFSLFRGNE